MPCDEGNTSSNPCSRAVGEGQGESQLSSGAGALLTARHWDQDFVNSFQEVTAGLCRTVNAEIWKQRAEQNPPFLNIPANGGKGFMEPSCLCGKAGR